jgi:hypothetical protein
MTTQFQTITFPSVNKNNSLAENFESMVVYGTNDVKCLIKKTIEMESYQFDGVANSLLENRPELWEQIGGAYSDAPEFEGLTDMEVFNNKELVEIFRKTCYTPVVEVKEKNGHRAFYVNTEGYGYARYVGVITNKNRKDN